MKKLFGFEFTQIFLKFLKQSYLSLAATGIVNGRTYLELRRKDPVARLFPWSVLRYERVASDLSQDDYIISASSIHPRAFREQLKYLKDNCDVIHLDALVAKIKTGQPISETTVVITFDGGFRDNYQTAFPILKELGLPATFFVPTSLIGTEDIYWEDQIAILIATLKKTRSSLPRLTALPAELYDHIQQGFQATTNPKDTARAIVAAIELADAEDREICLTELADVAVNLPPIEIDSLYMTWDQLRECQSAGIRIGTLGRFGLVVPGQTEEQFAEDLHLTFERLFQEKIDPSRVFAIPKGFVIDGLDEMLFKLGIPYAVGIDYFSAFYKAESAFLIKRVNVDSIASNSLTRFVARVAQLRSLGWEF